MKPSIFVGSSVESLDTAYAIQENLEHDAEVTVWTQGIFDLSKYTLDALVDQLDESDFGVFVFSPDDVERIRGKTVATARDNIVFELGLFVGRLGKERSLILLPRGCEDLHLPTDLLGITPGMFEAKRQDGNLVAALGPACSKIRKLLRRFGARPELAQGAMEEPTSSSDDELDENDALTIVEGWLGKQPVNTSGAEERYTYVDVARECKLPRSLVVKVFETAAARWDLEVVRKGKSTILMRNK